MKYMVRIISIVVIIYITIGVIIAFTTPAASPYRYDHNNGDKKYISIRDLAETSMIWPLYLLAGVH